MRRAGGEVKFPPRWWRRPRCAAPPPHWHRAPGRSAAAARTMRGRAGGAEPRRSQPNPAERSRARPNPAEPSRSAPRHTPSSPPPSVSQRTRKSRPAVTHRRPTLLIGPPRRHRPPRGLRRLSITPRRPAPPRRGLGAGRWRCEAALRRGHGAAGGEPHTTPAGPPQGSAIARGRLRVSPSAPSESRGEGRVSHSRCCFSLGLAARRRVSPAGLGPGGGGAGGGGGSVTGSRPAACRHPVCSGSPPGEGWGSHRAVASP